MRALVQRVGEASVSIAGALHAKTGPGLLILLGVSGTDTTAEAQALAGRCARLRIFSDEEGKMNRSVVDTGGSALVISQFTLYADTSHGNRPGFTAAAPPEIAEALYLEFVTALKKEMGENRVACGVFRAMMAIGSVNDGPVTIMLDTADRPVPR
jgi:D-aminoacyl-tRNA deacylase